MERRYFPKVGQTGLENQPTIHRDASMVCYMLAKVFLPARLWLQLVVDARNKMGTMGLP